MQRQRRRPRHDRHPRHLIAARRLVDDETVSKPLRPSGLITVGARRGAGPALERADEGARLRVAEHVGDVTHGEPRVAEVALGNTPTLVVHQRRQRCPSLAEAALKRACARPQLAGLELEIAVFEARADAGAYLGQGVSSRALLEERLRVSLEDPSQARLAAAGRERPDAPWDPENRARDPIARTAQPKKARWRPSSAGGGIARSTPAKVTSPATMRRNRPKVTPIAYC